MTQKKNIGKFSKTFRPAILKTKNFSKLQIIVYIYCFQSPEPSRTSKMELYAKIKLTAERH